MKKLLFILFIPILLFSLEHKVYKVGVLNNLKPYYFVDKNGNPSGYAVELFNEISKKTGIKYEYIIANSWNELFELSKTNQIDIIPNLGITKKRSELFVFSQPTDSFFITLFKRKDSSLVNSKENVLYDRIGVVSTNVCNTLVDKNLTDEKIIFSDIDKMLNALIKKEIDVFCYPNIISKNKKSQYIIPIGNPLKEIKRGIAIQKNNFELLPIIDESITNLRINGIYDEIYYKWLGNKKYNILKEGDLKSIIIGIVIIVFFILTFLILNRKLKIEREKQKILKIQVENNKQKYETIFQSNSIVSFLVEPSTGQIVDCNEAALSFYGYSFSSLINKTVFDINTLSKKEIIEKIKTVKDHSKSFEFEHIMSDKTIKDVRVFTTPVKIKDEKLLFSQVFDITEEKKNKIKLQQALLVFENTNDGIIITDKNTNIINVNKSFTETTGYSKKEVLGKRTNILRSNINNDTFYNKMWKSISLNGYWRGEIVNKHKSGRDYYEILTINALYNSDNNITGYVGIFSDISKEKNDEKIILQQSKVAAIGEMLGNISHQWRQPLSIITTYASGLKLSFDFDDEVTSERIINTMDEINSQAQYLSKTIDDFRNFFRGDNTETSRFSINDSFEKVFNLTRDSFNNNFIKYDIKSDDYYIYGNQNLFIQALINIYNNAKDALSEFVPNDNERYFDVHVYSEDEDVVIILRDNAGGIQENIISKIFEPYFTTKHQSIGTGIGLYMTNQIITKQFLGSISVDNSKFEKDGDLLVGATFKIVIPKN